MLLRIPKLALACAAALLLSPAAAWAHFIWLVPQTADNGAQVQIYFSEDASPDDAELLKRLQGIQVWQLSAGSEPRVLELAKTEKSLAAVVPAPGIGDSLVVAAHDLGVLDRGNNVFRLKYFAKSGPAAWAKAWTSVDSSKQLRLDVIPQFADGEVNVQVLFDGKPVSGAEVKASGPGLDDFAATSDAQGRAAFAAGQPGTYSLRARHVEEVPGELDGKKYPSTRYYTTVALNVAGQPVAASLPDLPEAVTSFGGAILDGFVYIYGGNTGSAHSYSKEGQAKVLRRLPLKGGAWETVAEGPGLQGLALVAHGGKLYRIGGFTALNEKDQERDLLSQTSVASFDPKTMQWTDLPPLPEARSSHDAAVVGDVVYVVGGWQLGGETDQQWHSTAWQLDLAGAKPEWKPLPAPSFHRRALALAEQNGKLYVIGGMQEEGGPTTRVDIFDPKMNAWSQGPNLVGEDGMTGFGASAFATGGRLYVSTIKGSLQRLSADGSAWEVIAETPTARFFHRMLPVDAQHLVMVGGANMKIGKFEKVELLNVQALPAATKN